MASTGTSPTWSYSSIKQFQTCPKQYYHLRLQKDFKDPPSPAMDYGNRFHKAAELYVRDGTKLPQEFMFAKATLDKLAQMRGTVLPEQKLALTANLEPCKFFDSNAWWRGIVDLLILNDGKAKILDYKTGKSAKYADVGQLELMTLATFKHYPEVKSVRAGLLFVLCDEFITADYTQDDVPDLWQKWLSAYGELKHAYKTWSWNPKPSGLCRQHCVVTDCIHNGRNS